MSIREGPVQGDPEIGRCRVAEQAISINYDVYFTLGFLLFKWKAVDTASVLLSFNLQFCRYDDSVAISRLRVFLNEDHSAAECTMAKSSA